VKKQVQQQNMKYSPSAKRVVVFKLPADLRRQVDRRAKKAGVSRAEYVRRVIAAELKTASLQPARGES